MDNNKENKNKDRERLRERERRERQLIDNKLLFKIYAKRFFIIMAYALPFVIAIAFVMDAYTNMDSWAYIIIDVGMLLLACFVGLVTFNKIDERRALKPRSKEDDRDPFAD